MLPVGKLNVQASLIMKLRTVTALTCLVALAACETTGPTLPTDVRALEQQAAQLAATGQLEQSVQTYTALVGATRGSTQSRFLIDGARVLMQIGNYGSARRWLTRAQRAAAPDQARRILLLLAEVEMAEGRPDAALELLGRVSELPTDELLADAAAVRGRALFGLGRVEEAVTTLINREFWLNTAEQILENHRLIWNGLVAQTASTPVVPSGDLVIDGWLALQPVAAGYRINPFGLQAGLLQWRQTYPSHPAAGTFLAELLGQTRLSQSYPEQIALLLPLSSVQQSVAKAVRDGFIAAHLDSSAEATAGTGAALRIYDTALLGPQEAYLRAQVEGADFIVGPLLKPELEEIMSGTGLIPTLALNSIDSEQPAPPNFYQFALAPEDEAIEVARHAAANGARNAIALVPNNDWGIRLLTSFRTELEALGGELLEFRGYDPGSQDFSLAITTLLNINRSNQRRLRLGANLGLPLEFEPRRRQDVDVIFVAADAGAGRLLAPQLRFHYAGDIPTYATSAIHENNASDSDLNGVLFPDAPWVLLEDPASLELKAALQSYWPQRASPPWTRLYGLGFDAYRLIPLLYNHPEGFFSVPAMSGELSLAEDGRVHRRLPLAQFRNGRPSPLEDGAIEEGTIDVEPALEPQETTELAELR